VTSEPWGESPRVVSGPAADPALMGSWMLDPGFGVYVHIPFCLHRCHYCDFNTYEGLDALHDPYVDALVRDIEVAQGDFPEATSVFFGGGTPTLLPARHLARILSAIRNRVGVAPGAEVTAECNPETIDDDYLTELRASGFNRVSIGVQSLRPSVLEGLGRQHSGARALEAIAAAKRAGFEDVNADLIYGSPWERPDDWRASLEGIVEAGTQHVAAYALTLEEGTPLHTLVATGRIPDVDPDVQADRHAVAEEILGAAGFWRYEVSNWSQMGFASRHNVLYWSGGNYLGFGAGAHGHLDGRRYWGTRLPRDFIAAAGAGETTEAGYEIVPEVERASEALMLALRLRSGVHLASFEARYGKEHLDSKASVIESLIDQGLLTRGNGWLAVAPDSTMLANDIIARLM
jgi:putative oxygen-independent coproporphyrinogen III oxidase